MHKDNIDRYLDLLCCPICKSKLLYNRSVLQCTICNASYPIKDGIPRFIHNTSSDLKLSIKKWDLFYRNRIKMGKFDSDLLEYKAMYFKDTYEQLNEVKKLKNSVYLEIGSGPFFMGQLLARKCSLVIGIDVSPEALKLAKKMLISRNVDNYLLIQGDILNMPIAESSINLIYGGGVIEHFKDTQKCVNELYRVLCNGGVSFNTVPMLNIGSLTYRQIWGNIPNILFLKQLAEYIHIKVLGSRHMVFGYELAFLPNTLRKIHQSAGFKKVYVDRFRVKLVFEFIPKFMRKTLIKLATSSPLFWPMIKVVAKK